MEGLRYLVDLSRLVFNIRSLTHCEFEPSSAHKCLSTCGKADTFSESCSLRPLLFNNRLDISEFFLKGPYNAYKKILNRFVKKMGHA